MKHPKNIKRLEIINAKVELSPVFKIFGFAIIKNDKALKVNVVRFGDIIIYRHRCIVCLKEARYDEVYPTGHIDYFCSEKCQRNHHKSNNERGIVYTRFPENSLREL